MFLVAGCLIISSFSVSSISCGRRGGPIEFSLLNPSLWREIEISLLKIEVYFMKSKFILSVLDNCPRRKLSPPHRTIASRTISPWMIAYRIIAPRKIAPHHKIFPENNFLLSSKFPPKSTTSELRTSMHGLWVL